MPILHAVQDALGYIPPGAVPVIGEILNLSRAEVHGVISFYHYFRHDAARPSHRSRLPRRSRANRWARALESHVKQRLGVGFPPTTARRRFYASSRSTASATARCRRPS